MQGRPPVELVVWAAVVRCGGPCSLLPLLMLWLSRAAVLPTTAVDSMLLPVFSSRRGSLASLWNLLCANRLLAAVVVADELTHSPSLARE